MKKNITTIITLSLFLLATLIKPTNAYGQITDSHYISNKTIVYWFNINLEIVTDSTTLLNNYKINQSTNTVQSGTIKAYDKIFIILVKNKTVYLNPKEKYIGLY